MSVTVKASDCYPIEFEANMDLTGATTVRLLAKRGRENAVSLVCTVTDAPAGVVTHVLTGDLPRGDYRIELEVTRPDTGPITFPTRQADADPQYEWLHVIPDLG